jgi:hypothetical protein
VGILERGRLVQQGNPEEIYTQPATPFVARFTGLSGELPVRVRARAADGTVEVELAGPAQARPFRARGPSLPIGEAAALLMVRPTGVQLCASHADDHHIAGTVADVAFRGRGYEHAIDIPGHGRLTGVFADTRAAPGGARRAAPGPARLPPVQRRARGAGPAGLSQPPAGAGQAMNGAGQARNVATGSAADRNGMSRCFITVFIAVSHYGISSPARP